MTPAVPAAIAVVEVCGPRAVELVQRHWQPAQGSPDLERNQIRYGSFHAYPDDPTTPGESILVVQRGEDRVELHCHGGLMASEAILAAFQRAGAHLASQQDWIARHAVDPFQAEATEDLLLAKTLRTTSILMDQWRGAMTQAIASIQEGLAQRRIREVQSLLETLRQRGEYGLHLVHPWRVVLCGPPNVGKSSLLNRLLGYARAIVHSEAGTTRDLLAEATSIEGWPVTLIDSAGVRTTDHTLESEGISRARGAIASADRLLVLVDPVQGWTEEHASIWIAHRHRCLLVQTKCDLNAGSPPHLPPDAEPHRVSASTGEGIAMLMQQLSHSLVPFPPQPGDAVPFRERHLELLQKWQRLLATI